MIDLFTLLEQDAQNKFYSKCQDSFVSMMKSNEDLELELGFPLQELKILNISISLILNNGYDEFIVDTKVSILSPETDFEIGYYRYQEDMNGHFVDEFFVIH